MRVYDGPWRKLRLLVLTRDGWQCQIQLDGCAGKARTVDHINPVDNGGSWYDPANLRAACKACNSKLGARQTNHKRWGGKPSRDW